MNGTLAHCNPHFPSITAMCIATELLHWIHCRKCFSFSTTVLAKGRFSLRHVNRFKHSRTICNEFWKRVLLNLLIQRINFDLVSSTNKDKIAFTCACIWEFYHQKNTSLNWYCGSDLTTKIRFKFLSPEIHRMQRFVHKTTLIIPSEK